MRYLLYHTPPVIWESFVQKLASQIRTKRAWNVGLGISNGSSQWFDVNSFPNLTFLASHSLFLSVPANLCLCFRYPRQQEKGNTLGRNRFLEESCINYIKCTEHLLWPCCLSAGTPPKTMQLKVTHRCWLWASCPFPRCCSNWRPGGPVRT